MHSTNLPNGWVAAYLDVERLDDQWCRITAWPPYADIGSPQITKCSLGVWEDWIKIATDSDMVNVVKQTRSDNYANLALFDTSGQKFILRVYFSGDKKIELCRSDWSVAWTIS